MKIWEMAGAQLRRPSGRLAGVCGTAMRWINREPYRLAIAALDVQPTDQVLELGFGMGDGLRALSALAGRGIVWGVDHSEAMLAQAEKRNFDAIARNKVKLLQATFEALPLRNASIDRILAVNVAYFWNDGSAVVGEICRVLKPGGRLSIYVTDAAAMQHWAFVRFGTHKTFTADSLREYLAGSSFATEQIRVQSAKLTLGVPALIATAERDRKP